ncbi:MAG TPA: phosphatidate cytidylyltransferase [Beijerinckiaceae bacterium]|nr:phosphatidate cytidylyltransferase [Beijerinckiaceae bacterium]
MADLGQQARPAGSELGLRVASSLVLAAFALFATYMGGWLFAALWILAALAIFIEWIMMTRYEPGWVAAGLAYAAVIAIVPPLVREDPRLGIAAILWMFAVVWFTDIAAYFTGRALGGPKLCPAVSPKKTWSGFLGGLAAAIIAGAGVAMIASRFGWQPPVSLPVVVLVSGVASVLSQIGDLGESALKRRFGAKDSGRLIPGHGGVMDRLDGFWAVAALMGVALAGAHGVRGG